MKTISTQDAPKPQGHYSQAIVSRGLVYVSGQLPLNVDGTHFTAAKFEEQVVRVLENLEAILVATGTSRKNLLKVTAYIVGVENWPEFNRIYAEWVPDAFPARSVVPVPQLHHGYLIEIDAIASE